MVSVPASLNLSRTTFAAVLEPRDAAYCRSSSEGMSLQNMHETPKPFYGTTADNHFIGLMYGAFVCVHSLQDGLSAIYIYNCVYLYVHLFKVVPQFVFLHGAGAWLTCVPFFLDLVALASDCFVSLGNSYAKSPTFVATSFFFFILIAKVLFKECFLAGLCAV